jgi:UDP-N-acetylmuramate--alanine ligase
MSGIAELLHQSGYSVSGSDLREGPTVDHLRELGVDVRIGHDASQLGDVDVVVYSSAVPARNPELLAAEQAHVPVIPRAEMLAELMRLHCGVAIAGSHGKTTTTSLTGAVLQGGGLDPTVVVGGRVKSFGSHSRLGEGDILVAEADESDGSFLRLVPTVVAVTNVDREHLDHYGDFEQLKQAFLDFCNRVPFYGACMLCLDDPVVQSLLPAIARRSVTYGLATQAEVSADSVEAHGFGSSFRVRRGGDRLGSVRLPLPGRHNVRNALAALAIGLEFEVPFDAMADALESFVGVERRFEVRADRAGILVVDDYAHHPAEIRATLEAARASHDRRIVVAFQPHRYTRTRDLFDELAGAFHDADCVVLTEIYAAGEAKIPGVEAARLADAIRGAGHRSVRFVPEGEVLIRVVREQVRRGDLVLFMGAGDISRRATEFTALLEEEPGD